MANPDPTQGGLTLQQLLASSGAVPAPGAQTMPTDLTTGMTTQTMPDTNLDSGPKMASVSSPNPNAISNQSDTDSLAGILSAARSMPAAQQMPDALRAQMSQALPPKPPTLLSTTPAENQAENQVRSLALKQPTGLTPAEKILGGQLGQGPTVPGSSTGIGVYGVKMPSAMQPATPTPDITPPVVTNPLTPEQQQVGAPGNAPVLPGLGQPTPTMPTLANQSFLQRLENAAGIRKAEGIAKGIGGGIAGATGFGGLKNQIPILDAEGRPIPVVKRDAQGNIIPDDKGNPQPVLDKRGNPTYETRPPTAGEKGQRIVGAIGHLLGGIGSAGVMATGSPEQKSQEIELQKNQTQERLAQQQAIANNLYKTGMLHVGQQKADTGDTNAATKALGVNGMLAKNGFISDSNEPTGVRHLREGDSGYAEWEAANDAALAAKRASAYKTDQQARTIQANREGLVHITPEMAEAANRPDLANQDVPNLTYRQNIGNYLEGHHSTISDEGPEGTFLRSTIDGHIIKKLTDFSKIQSQEETSRQNNAANNASKPTAAQNMVGGVVNGRQIAVPADQAGNYKWDAGGEPAKIGAAETEKIQNARGLSTVFDSNNPDDPGTIQLARKLDSEGKLGPVSSRYQDFLNRGGSTVADFIGANPDLMGDPDVQRLFTKLGLAETGLMQVHMGARGSSAMLEHFQELANAKALSGKAFLTALDAESRYVNMKAMNPYATNSTSSGPAPPAKPGAPKQVGAGKAGKYS